MAGGENAHSKWGDKKMVGEDGVRTVDCLRGRLLAERAASRNAKEEAEKLGNKLMELENMLKQEAKSRNRAEKKLKFLLKKLESLNISYASDESEHLCLVDKSEISSVSSSTSSSTKEPQENRDNQKMETAKTYASQESAKSTTDSNKLQQNDLRSCVLNLCDDRPTNEGCSSTAFEVNLPEVKGHECEMGANKDPRTPSIPENVGQNVTHNAADKDALSSEGDAHSEKSSQVGSNQYCNDSKMDEQSDIYHPSVGSSTEEGCKREEDREPDRQMDNSMALVPVDLPQENHRVDPEVLDNTVREVLDALRYAKKQLQSSMERRRRNMIRVG